MKKYLLEIGTEELPAGQINEAQSTLKNSFEKELNQAGLSFSSIQTYSTPRRLAVIVEGLAERQETTSKKVKGPPVKDSFDEAGKPKPSATGFADKHGLRVDQLDKEDFGGREHLVANVTIEGKSAADVLGDLVPRVIGSLSFERPMRWGSSDMKFSRPIRWVVSLLDVDVVPIDLDGIKAGRQTQGHRILSPGTVEIVQVDEYIGALRSRNVIASPEERRQIILKQVQDLASAVGGKARLLSGPLLDEVVNLTEWPHAIMGSFSSDYLSLPGTLLETVMVHHQRYFPVERVRTADNNGASKPQKNDSSRATANDLLPYFITVSNNHRDQAAATIKQGNERVLKARLADGKFFYFDDQRTKLGERKDQLSQLTYQQGLGTYKDKTERLARLADLLTKKLSLEAKIAIPLERAMELFKLDLVTNLVRELPELQGYVGSWYAEIEGAPPEVVQAIASHYSPRHNDDTIPGDLVGRFVAVLDKIDHVTGLFLLGKRPTGSSDPFALRRNAQGVVDIVVDGLADYHVDAAWMIDELTQSFEPLLADERAKRKRTAEPKEGKDNKTKFEIEDFIAQRLRAKLLDRGFPREIVEAVMTVRNPLEDMADTVVRCCSLQKLLASKDGFEVVRGGVRVGNILDANSGDKVDENKLHEPIEKELWKGFNDLVKSEWEQNGVFKSPANQEDYDKLLELLRPLSPLINQFFDGVMVNDPDKVKKENRHALLKNIDKYYRSVANFPKLQPLLP